MKQSRTRINGAVRAFSAMIVGIVFSLATPSHAETNPKFYAVQASATVQASPAQITLSWAADANATSYAISRKAPTASSWTTLGSVAGSATSYVDANVAAGSAYEYQIQKTTSAGYRGFGYLYAGINAPLIENRGKLILIVDNTHAADLAPELARLQEDLVGDGWTVIRQDVPRTESVSAVKNRIKTAYAADSANVKAVFLFGHIAVPYSGNFNPDGHPDHQGAWPADAYYGDMDGNWTDSSVYTTSAERAPNRNVPGDGKFDQSDLPSAVELQVGRVDLYNMTCFANKTPSRSEKDLLRQYLNKHHNFRHKLLNVERRGLICDNFGEKDGEAFAASGWRNFSSFFGAENVTQVSGWQYFPTVSAGTYLWSYGCGGGSWYTCDGVGSSDDFARTDVKSVFTMFLGSYFGDWDNESAFLRAPLGSTSYTLASSWAGRPHNFYHHMALGETIGHGIRLSQNNGYGGLYSPQNYGTKQVHIALMGDPTLRMHPVAPPAALSAAAVSGKIALTWGAAADTDIHGYHVYRGASANGPFTRVTGSAPVTATTFTDSPAAGTHTYMVRAIKLERSASGTYLNPSQGVFVTANTTTGQVGGGGTGGGTVTVPAAPTSLAASAVSTSQINLSWTDNAANETAFKVERKAGASGTFSQIASVGADVRSYSNTGLTAGTQYYFRVRANNTAGDSAYSNEANATTQAGTATTVASATFVTTDATARGTWKGIYGGEGYAVVGNAISYPTYAQVTPAAKSDWTWTFSTADTRCLQKAGAATDRIASCWYASSSFSINVNLTDGQTHRVALYCLDWDSLGRVQTIDVLDTATSTVLSSQSLSAFSGGKYVVWDVKGTVTFRLTRTAGPNAVVSGIFFGPAGSATSTVATPSITPGSGTFTAPVTVSLATATSGATIRYTLDGSTPTSASTPYAAPVVVSSTATLRARAFKSGMTDSGVASASFSISTASTGGQTKAVFVKTDSSTKGNWKGAYGSDGYAMAGEAEAYPNYAEVTTSGPASYVWSDTSTDQRALQQPGLSMFRTAGCWFSPTSFSVDANLTDGNTHRLALYLLDWDTTARAQIVEVLDAQTGAVLSTQSVTDFSGGKYLVWDVKGNVRFRFTRTAGNNAVLMGLFFSPAPAQLSGSSTTTGGDTAPLGWSRLANGGFEVRLNGLVGQTMVVEVSSDLVNWASVETLTIAEPDQAYVDTNTWEFPIKFYRTKPAE